MQFTASGEVLALGGYAFPPATAGDPDFVDGWEVHFTKLLAVFDKMTLSENPDTSPTDQSQTGKLVAEIDGPWAIDLHKGGPLIGKGGTDEQAFPIEMIDNQNKNGGAPFDPTMRYAFGFDSVPATASAQALADRRGRSRLRARWCRTAGTCSTSAPRRGRARTGRHLHVDQPELRLLDAADDGQLPPRLRVRRRRYVNCQNPDNDPAKALGGEEHQRGVQVKANQTTIAQVTFHTDHPFWESFTHDTPAHFDQLAALAQKQSDGTYLVTLDDTKASTTRRSRIRRAIRCRGAPATPSYMPPNTNAQMGFDSLSIPHNPSGDPGSAMRDYHDYMSYDQSTQGHLNSDGLCFVARHYPSPQ